MIAGESLVRKEYSECVIVEIDENREIHKNHTRHTVKLLHQYEMQ